MKTFYLVILAIISSGQIRTQNVSVKTNSSLLESEEEGIRSESENKPSLAKEILPTPRGYRRWELPLHSTKKWRVYAFVSIFVRQILEVDEKNEQLVLDTDFGLQWVDWKVFEHLKNSSVNSTFGIEHKTVDADVLKRIWKPDVYIDEMASVEKAALVSQLITLTLLGGSYSGDIVYSARKTLKLRCEMSFQFFPADTQTCQYYVRSYSYNATVFNLMWNAVEQSKGIYLNDPSDPNFDIQISSIGPSTGKLFIEEKFDDFRKGNYTALTFTIKARRKLSYHLVQTYLPSVLLILITWLCFLLPGDMVEARIGISMTTLLTLTAMFGSVREQSPEVSYTMAIDIWMVFCISLVFLALFMFTIIYWMTRKISKRDKGEDQEAASVSIATIPVSRCNIFRDVVKHYSFIAFAIISLTFIILYWSLLLYLSDYCSWDPNPELNAVSEEEEDGGSLYKFHETEEDPFYSGEITTTTDTNGEM